MDTLTKPEVTATPWKRVAAWGGPPLFAVVAVGAIWLFDAQGAAGARDAAYVLAALFWAPVLLVATRLWYVDRADVSLHRACQVALGVAMALFFPPSFLVGMLGHDVGGWAVGVSAVAWFVLAWVGIFRTGHLIEDRYGPGGWAP
jgi:hypothetical protein